MFVGATLWATPTIQTNTATPPPTYPGPVVMTIANLSDADLEISDGDQHTEIVAKGATYAGFFPSGITIFSAVGAPVATQPLVLLPVHSYNFGWWGTVTSGYGLNVYDIHEVKAPEKESHEGRNFKAGILISAVLLGGLIFLVAHFKLV